jgi:hypothetical protein
MIKLGEKVIDSITGYSGIVTARVEYPSGCIQYLVTPKTCKEKGSMPKGEWIDENRLVAKEVTKGSGGPQSKNPSGMPTPR